MQGVRTLSLTDMARADLSCGSFDALRASHFLRRFPPHFHDTFAIGVVESGLTRLRTPRGEWLARPGTILAFSPGEIHSAEPVGAAGFTYRMIYPTRELLREIHAAIAPSGAGPSFRLPVIDDPRLALALRRAHRPLMDGSARGDDEARLVGGIRALAERYGAPCADTGGDPAHELTVVFRARDYLHDRFAEPVRLAALAEVAGVNPFQLIRLFGRVMGVPPYAYLIQLRVNRAQAMLGRGAAISHVAYACGFSDQSHLTRTFKRAVGVPPGQYARSVRQSAA